MALELSKPICFFDLETTGINIVKDRIVEISILKLFPNGTRKQQSWLVNPEMPIPADATAVHGISDDKVANEPTFKQLAHEIYDWFKDADLAGFNSDRFDIPMLIEELLRVGVDVDLKKMVSVDVQTIFHKMEKRTLTAAYKFYCNKDLEDAHSAEADTLATYEFTSRQDRVDFAGMLTKDEKGVPVFNFGKHKGVPVLEVLEKEPGYFGWILGADFPLYTKKVLTQIKLGTYFKSKL
jgi:DNA polymerase-3 subunit epsilon